MILFAAVSPQTPKKMLAMALVMSGRGEDGRPTVGRLPLAVGRLRKQPKEAILPAAEELLPATQGCYQG